MLDACWERVVRGLSLHTAERLPAPFFFCVIFVQNSVKKIVKNPYIFFCGAGNLAAMVMYCLTNGDFSVGGLPLLYNGIEAFGYLILDAAALEEGYIFHFLNQFLA